MEKYKSTVPGMTYPSNRDNKQKTGLNFLDGRRKDDGAEDLWRIHNNLYDLETFIKNHPGGSEWLEMTRGTDITEAFEVHHITDKPERILKKFYVRKATASRSLGYTFDPSGFYRKFKERAREALKDVDLHNPALQTKLIADSILITTLLLSITAAVLKSWLLVPVSGLFFAWTAIVGHNFLHMKDNFRMYYFDVSIMSSKEWRITHALSHHLYTNTVWDLEITNFEPFLQYLPNKNKSVLRRLFLIITSPIFYCFAFFLEGFKRYYLLYKQGKFPEFRDLIPLLLPVILSICTLSISEGVKFWLWIVLFGSIIFNFIGFNAAHHHPDIFHDGDISRPDVDWGLMQLDAVRDRNVIDDSLFLILTNFGSHTLHHLLPTVDHAYLKLCLPAFQETCREFGIRYDKLSQWEMIKGQYKQMMRMEPRVNFLGASEKSSTKYAM